MAKKEAEIQRDICRYLRSQGHLFWRNSPQTYNPKLGIHIKHEFIPNGLPDIIVLHPGNTAEWPSPVCIGLEVKTPKGKQSADQKLIERRFLLSKHEYRVVRSVTDVEKIGL